MCIFKGHVKCQISYCAPLNCPVISKMDISNSYVKVRSKFVLKDDSLISKKSRVHFEDVEPTWFNNLPIKVLVNIFKYFDERELRKCILPVS